MSTILIVDDSTPNRELMVALLGTAGHRLLQARDGDDALLLVAADRPDLVITDILMPTMDGHEFVRLLRGNPATSKIPVIFWSAEYHEQEAHEVARACGFAWTLTRPTRPEVILRTVSAALSESDVEPDHWRLTGELSEKAAQLRVVGLRLEALIESDLEMADESDPIRLLDRYCSGARKLFGARYVALYVADERLPDAEHFCVSGLPKEVVPVLRPSRPLRGVLAEVEEQHQTVMAQNPGGDPVALGFGASHPPIASILAAPITALAHTYGWLYLVDKIGAAGFTDRDERLLRILSKQVGRFYENGSAFKEAKRHAAALAVEIAERRSAKEALRRNEEHTRFALAAAGVGTWEADLVSGAARWSEIHEALHGLPPGGFAGTLAAYLSTIHPADRKSVSDSIGAVSETRADLVNTYRTVWQDGSVHWIQGRGRFFHGESGAIRGTGVAIDITERRLLEEQYLQSQKMEAVGQLAGGVAHDFNNLLTAILGYVELLSPTFPPQDARLHDLDQIRRSAIRATHLTRQLLAFSRRQILQAAIVDLNALVTDLAILLRRLIGEDIELRLSLDNALERIKADSGQIEQVVMNLAINARDAMPTGGRLTIATSHVDVGEEFFRLHALRAESGVRKCVLLTVTDTGTGMDAETRRRIFEPFFTTKAQGKGTGLGLATVYGIVKQSGGWIWVESEPGEGATFKVYLPRTAEPVVRDAPTVSQTLRSGSETILLVEDEDAVRCLTRDLLERQGYRVIEAQNAEDAIVTASGEMQPIHLLLTDVVMPGESGPELFQRLQPLRPDMKVLYVSGYADEVIVQKGILNPRAAFLQKPFTAFGFLQKVRDVLDAGVATTHCAI